MQIGDLPGQLPASTPLMRDRDFLKMFVSEGSAGVGSQVSLLALPLAAIVLLHSSAFEVGALAALGTLPYLLFGLHAGVFLERVRRRPVLVYSALGRAAVLTVVPISWALGLLDVEVLYVVAFLVGLMTTFYDIAWQAYLPSLVGTSRLHEASARLSLCDSGSQLVGPGLAGFLIRALSTIDVRARNGSLMLAALCLIAASDAVVPTLSAVDHGTPSGNTQMTSATMRAVRRLPPDTVIATGVNTLLYTDTGRASIRVPVRVHQLTNRPNGSFTSHRGGDGGGGAAWQVLRGDPTQRGVIPIVPANRGYRHRAVCQLRRGRRPE